MKRIDAVKRNNRKEHQMSALLDWIVVGAGLAIGKLLVAIAVITVVTAILAVFFIIEEKTK
jgi:hypothetical protein